MPSKGRRRESSMDQYMNNTNTDGEIGTRNISNQIVKKQSNKTPAYAGPRQAWS